MSEGLGASPQGEGAGPRAGGMPAASVPTVKKFFLVEYMDEVRRGLTWMRSSPKPDQPIVAKVQGGLIRWSKLRKARVGMVVVVAMIAASYGLFAVQAGQTPVTQIVPVGPGPTGNTFNQSFGGHVMENGNVTQSVKNITVSHFAVFRATLSWTDEPAGGIARTNQPDSLGLEVHAPNGLNWSKAVSTTSPQTWSVEDPAVDYGVGDWTFTVLGGTMGDVTRAGGFPCLTCPADTGNDFTLKIEAAW